MNFKLPKISLACALMIVLPTQFAYSRSGGGGGARGGGGAHRGGGGAHIGGAHIGGGGARMGGGGVPHIGGGATRMGGGAAPRMGGVAVPHIGGGGGPRMGGAVPHLGGGSAPRFSGGGHFAGGAIGGSPRFNPPGGGFRANSRAVGGANFNRGSAGPAHLNTSTANRPHLNPGALGVTRLNPGMAANPRTNSGAAGAHFNSGGGHLNNAAALRAGGHAPINNPNFRPHLNANTGIRNNSTNSVHNNTANAFRNNRTNNFVPNNHPAWIHNNANQNNSVHRNATNFRNNLNSTTNNHFASNRSSITNNNNLNIRNVSRIGNNVAIGNRNYAFANSGYRPAYFNHNFYHGYWNANRGYGPYGRYGRYGYGGYGPWGYGGSGIGNGFGYGLGTGLGFSLGYGLGYGGFGYMPFGWGMSGWGLGSMLYNSGYIGYYNPYYSGYGSYGGLVDLGYSGYDYSQPLVVAYDTEQPPNPSADDLLNTAIAAFKQGDYDNALDSTNRAISANPNDNVLHEFRALTLFAKGDYRQAAATLHSLLAVGPGWDWTTMNSLYPDVAIYTSQLRSLETFVREHPDDAGAHFVLAYHYMTDGYPENAAKQLKDVLRVVPTDRVASDIDRMLTSQQNAQGTQFATNDSNQPDQPSVANGRPIPQPPVADVPTVNPSADTNPIESDTPINPDLVVGQWKATRADGSTFELSMTNDKKFTWSYSGRQQAARKLSGTYVIQGSTLALEQEGGGTMIAQVAQSENGREFNFKPLGAPPEDPGLTFTK